MKKISQSQSHLQGVDEKTALQIAIIESMETLQEEQNYRSNKQPEVMTIPLNKVWTMVIFSMGVQYQELNLMFMCGEWNFKSFVIISLTLPLPLSHTKFTEETGRGSLL